MKKLIRALKRRPTIVILIALIIVLGFFAAVRAQQPAKPPTPEQEAEAAQKALVAAARDLDTAKASFDLALANRNAALYKVLAELSIKPSECGPKENPFACVTISPAGAVSAVKPQAAKTAPK